MDTSYTYDPNGNTIGIHLPDGQNITQEYDAYNRLIRTTAPLGLSRTYTYDYKDNLISSTDANGHTITYGYDVLGRRTSMTDANGHTTSFTYDPAGNMLTLTDAKGNTTSFTYDALNRLVRKTYPDGVAYTYSYDAIGRMVSQTDLNGNTINYAYDRLGRLVQKQFPDSTNADYAYDLAGKLLTGTNPDSTVTYTYDAAGHVTSATQNGKTISYSYDAVGNRVSMTTPEGEVVQYNYNDGNFMTRIQLSNGTGISYSHDSLGRITRRDYTGGVYATITYDNAGRLVKLVYNKADGTVIYTQSNVLDNASNIVQKTTETGTTAYSYDNTYQLLTADHPAMTDEQYSYDPVGNRLTSAEFNDWTYNNRNELSRYDGITFNYDNNGNTITKTDVNGTTTYHYNYENRMIRVDLPGGGTATYKYDVLGRRVEKNVNGVITQFLWDGNMLLAEYDGTGSLKRNYFSGADDMNPSMMVEAGQVYFYVKDHLDTPQKVVDESGDVKWTGEYSAFGEVTVSLNDVTNHFRFPGQYLDGETGLYYNYQRYYDPTLGRYMSEDQIGFIDGVNLYQYVLSNPVVLIDPFGLAVGSPGTWESLIPIWGSGRSAINQFQHGNITCGLIYSALTASDFLLAKAIVTGLAKGAVKVSGSFAWRSVRSWYGKKGFAETGQHVHHWLISQRGRIGKYVPEWIKNQPWNLMPMRSPKFHYQVHGWGPDAFNILGRLWYSTPQWAKAFVTSTVGRILNLCKTCEE